MKKVEAARSPAGPEGQKYLVSGTHVAMRLWDAEAPHQDKEPRTRDYETVGYVLGGRAELEIEGQTIRLAPGDSYLVPRGARHTYRIEESLSVVEATAPPARVDGRDDA